MGRSGVTEDVAERRALVVKLRRDRVPFAEIGEKHLGGVSAQRAHQIYRDALDSIPAQQVDEHRAEDLDLIDRATGELLDIAFDPSVSPRTRVEAFSALRGWSERRAKLVGYDAPTQVQAEVLQGTPADIELRELIQQEQARNEVALASLRGQACRTGIWWWGRGWWSVRRGRSWRRRSRWSRSSAPWSWRFPAWCRRD